MSTTPAAARSSSRDWSAPATTFVGNLSYVAVAVVGGIQVATGQITLGSIQAFIQYVRQFNQPLTQVAGMYNTLQSGIASAERVFDLLDSEEEPPEKSDPLPSSNGATAAGSSSSTSTSPTGRARPSSRTCRWSPSPAARSRSSARPGRARPRWSTC